MFRQIFNNIFRTARQTAENLGGLGSDTLFPNGAEPAAPAMKTPPASQRAINSLPMVKVTADDVMEVTNKECLICLEEQCIGSWSCKLQCGHLFHRQCLVEWLEKHCTCPVCRYEIETDDSKYEEGRKKRMEVRKLRLRKDELQRKSVAQLRDLANNLSVNISGFIDKHEIIEALIGSGRIEIVEGAPPVELATAEFYTLSVAQLRHMLLSFGISDRDALEKADLRSRLLDSGRIVLIEALNQATTSGTETGTDSRGGAPAADRTSYSFSLPTATTDSYKLSELRNMSVGDLRVICTKHAISMDGCLDKSDVIERVQDSNKVTVLRDSHSPQDSPDEVNCKMSVEDTESTAADTTEDHCFDNTNATQKDNYKYHDAEEMVVVEDVSDNEAAECPRRRRRLNRTNDDSAQASCGIKKDGSSC